MNLSDITVGDPEDRPREVVHHVEFGETIEGISLTYGVPIAHIRERNGLHGDQIYARTDLIIPDPKDYYARSEEDQLQLERLKREMIIASFVEVVLCPEDKCSKTAQFYLSEHQFSFEKAKEAYESDRLWQKKIALQSEMQKLETAQGRGQETGCLGAIKNMFAGRPQRGSAGIELQERAFLKRD